MLNPSCMTGLVAPACQQCIQFATLLVYYIKTEPMMVGPFANVLHLPTYTKINVSIIYYIVAISNPNSAELSVYHEDTFKPVAAISSVI